MRHNIKADIRTPSEWNEMSRDRRDKFLIGQLHYLALAVEAGEANTETRLDVNGNTIAVVVRGRSGGAQHEKRFGRRKPRAVSNCAGRAQD